MTDKEKAEEILQTKGCNTFCVSCGYTEKVIEFIAIGLAEGRKEGYEKGLDTFPNTRRENRELIDKLNLQNQRLNVLKKEKEEMKNQIEIQYKGNQTLGNNNTKLLDKIQSLKAQIEKMKCCQMCKHLENSGSCLKANDKEVKEWGNFLIETRRTHYCTNWELVE